MINALRPLSPEMAGRSVRLRDVVVRERTSVGASLLSLQAARRRAGILATDERIRGDNGASADRREVLMRNIARLLGWTMALSLSMVTPDLAAQSPADEDARRAVANCIATDCLLRRAPVLDAPFSAVATTVWRPPATSGRAEMRATARYYRDSAGRVRIEQGRVGDDGPRRIMLVPGTEGHEAYLLDPVARTTSLIPRGLVQMMIGGGGNNNFILPLTGNRFMSLYQVPTANLNSSEEPLGQRTVEGIDVTGRRFPVWVLSSADNIGYGERWVSPELKLVVYSQGEHYESGTVEYSLTKISRAEPRADLFEAPADYDVTEAHYPFTWAGPKRALDRRLFFGQSDEP